MPASASFSYAFFQMEETDRQTLRPLIYAFCCVGRRLVLCSTVLLAGWLTVRAGYYASVGLDGDIVAAEQAETFRQRLS